MYCCFDITTKIAYEFEKTATDFEEYPRLVSSDKKSDAKKLENDFKEIYRFVIKDKVLFSIVIINNIMTKRYYYVKISTI
jgi:hypothetical protein